jgi:hypothetical protein
MLFWEELLPRTQYACGFQPFFTPKQKKETYPLVRCQMLFYGIFINNHKLMTIWRTPWNFSRTTGWEPFLYALQQKGQHKATGVDFIKVFCAHFSYESAFCWKNVTRESTFVQKTRAKNVDEIDTWQKKLIVEYWFLINFNHYLNYH